MVFWRRLDGRGEEHDAARSTEHLSGEVGGELALDDTRVAVGARDAAPDDADTRAVDLTLGLVDVGDALGGSAFLCLVEEIGLPRGEGRWDGMRRLRCTVAERHRSNILDARAADVTLEETSRRLGARTED